jgi:hypothetical protein
MQDIMENLFGIEFSNDDYYDYCGRRAFKQVLIDSGIGTDLAVFFETSTLSPLVLGWVFCSNDYLDSFRFSNRSRINCGGMQPLVLVQE